jgi:hypothetical protein
MHVRERSWRIRARRVLPAADRNLLRAILADGEIARDAYAAWRRELDWSTIPPGWQKLLPILHHNATRLGIDDPLLKRMGGVRRYLWARNLRLMQLAKTVHGALVAAAVPVMALKGSALVAHRFVNRSIRPMEDLDILVPPDHVANAMDALEGLGMHAWPFRRDSVLRRVLPQAEVSGSAFRTAAGDYIDLHWNAMHLDRRPSADVPMWQRSCSIDFEGVHIRVPDPVDLVLQICGHGAQDGGAALLRAVVDTAILIRATTPFDWDALSARAGEHRMSAVVSDAFGLLADAIGDEDIAGARDALACQATLAEQIEAWAERCNPGYRRPGLIGVLAAAADYRRRRAALFCAPLSAVLLAWMRADMCTRSVVAALARLVYLAARRPRLLRRLLASDRRLALPEAEELTPISGTADITKDDLGEAHFIAGWSLGEDAGRWTDGRIATLALRIDPADHGRPYLAFDLTCAVPIEGKPMEIKVYIADRFVTTRRFWPSVVDNTPLITSVPQQRGPFAAVVPITFEIAEPFQPAAATGSSDGRRLGLLLRAIRIGGES